MFDDFSSILSAIISLILVVAIFFGAHYATKMFGGKYQNLGKGNIKILEKTVMGKDQYLVIAKVGDKILLLGVTGNNINLIDTLEGYIPLENDNNQSSSFYEILSKNIKDNFTKNKND